MNYLGISGFINSILILFIGLFVFLKNKKDLKNQIFFLFSLTLIGWQLNYGFWQIAQSEEESLFFLRLLMIGTFSSPVFFHLTLLLLDNLKKWRKFLISAYIITFLLYFLVFSPYFISGFKSYNFYSFWPQAGIGANLANGWGLIIVVITLYLLIKSRLHLTGEKKNQTDYFILGFFILIIASVFNLPQWYGIELYPYGNFLIFLYPLIIAFAILRYHLFGIKIILTELLVGVMGIILLILPFLMPTTFLKILTTIVFLLFCVFGYYLIKATHEEEKRREEAEKLASQEKVLRKKAEDLAEGLKQLNEAIY